MIEVPLYILRRAPHSGVSGEDVGFEEEQLMFEVHDLGSRLQG